MWERFSFYGMRAFLILYMVAPPATGGLGLSDARAASIYGAYGASVWGATIVGGVVADRFLGQYRSVLAGGVLIAGGHFTLAVPFPTFFYAGLALIALGTGLLKPSITTLVGSLYESADARRDAGFSLFYMGISLGGFLGPLIAGYLAQRVDWHLGFACAGTGMVFGLTQYIVGKHRLRPALDRVTMKRRRASVVASEAATASTGRLGFSRDEWKRIGAIVVLCLIAVLFWGARDQAGSTLNLFADRYTRLDLFGFAFPSTWFQSIPSILGILLAPIFAWMWMRLGAREPSVPAKFALGLVFLSLSFLVLVPAGSMAQASLGTRVSPWWLIASYVLAVCGEISLGVVGLSAITRVAPVRVAGMMMGLWFLATAFGNLLAGWAAGFFSTTPLQTLFGVVTSVLLAGALFTLIIVGRLRRLMGEGRTSVGTVD
jgi:proton-dependent oligopeptide transporter, POT family